MANPPMALSKFRLGEKVDGPWARHTEKVASIERGFHYFVASWEHDVLILGSGNPFIGILWFGEVFSCPCLVSRNELHQTSFNKGAQ